MMKLTYRGISYQPQTPEQKPSWAKYLANSNQDKDKDQDKIILVKPIHYYTYRGVSYTKSLVFDHHSKALLDIDRQ